MSKMLSGGEDDSTLSYFISGCIADLSQRERSLWRMASIDSVRKPYNGSYNIRGYRYEWKAAEKQEKLCPASEILAQGISFDYVVFGVREGLLVGVQPASIASFLSNYAIGISQEARKL